MAFPFISIKADTEDDHSGVKLAIGYNIFISIFRPFHANNRTI